MKATSNIRAIGAFDAALLEELMRRVFGTEEIGTAGEAWSKKSIEDVLNMAGFTGYLVQLDGTPAGFILCRAGLDEAEVLTLGVLREFRRKGLGRSLLDAVLETFRGSSIERVLLEVGTENKIARDFYADMSFREISRRPQYYKTGEGKSEDALILCRKTKER